MSSSTPARSATVAVACRWPDLLAAAVWFGLLTGLAEIAQTRLIPGPMDAPMPFPATLYWLVPTVDLLLFGALGLVLLPVLGLTPRAGRARIALFALLFPALFALALEYQSINTTALVVLCVGGATVATRVLATRVIGLRTLVRRTLPWLATALLATLLLERLVPPWLAQRELAALPAAAKGPNVLLLVLDTVRSDHLGAYGYGRGTTPNLDALAARSVVFDQAFSASPWTLPSHATLFTGRYPTETSADWLQPLDTAHTTLGEVLGQTGYATAGFVGNVVYAASTHGLDRGFQHYADFDFRTLLRWGTAFSRAYMRNSKGHAWHVLARTPGATVVDRLLAWQPSIGDRPFFAFLNFFDAHALYHAPAPYDRCLGPTVNRVGKWSTRPAAWSPELTQELIDAYDSCIAYVDAQVGRLLHRLEQSGQLANTLIVVTADHGEQFGEHGISGHGNSLYRQLLHVPLMLSWPGHLPSGVRVAEPVTLRDVPATILALVGIHAAFPGSPLPGLGLAPAAATPPSAILAEVSQGIRTPSWEPNAKGPMRSLISGGLHYILNGDGVEQLFDLAADSAQVVDLAATRPNDLARLRAQLAVALD